MSSTITLPKFVEQELSSRLAVQHPCQVSFKSMQRCRRSWEDKLKYVQILSVKGHNSAKICRSWIISPHALLDLWYNICTKFHSNPCKNVGGVEKTNFDGTEWRTKQTLKSHSLRASDRFGHRKNRFCLNSYYWLLLVYET